MKTFEFFNPVKIIFGEGEIKKLEHEIPPKSKILITFGGGSIKKNGVYEQVKESLSTFEILEFGGIEANPKIETLMKAVEIVRKENINFLLAVGGGSVIDGTKFISAASCFSGDEWDILSKNAPIKQAIPFGTVLTLAATGSEMNAGAVITREKSKEKLVFSNPIVFPKFSILDPTTTFSLNKRQRANGIIDSFVHVVEQYVTTDTNSPIQDGYAETILKTLISESENYLNTNNLQTASNVMWASTMALNGLLSTGGVDTDWSVHIIGHELTAFHGIDHAATLAIVLPGVWEIQKSEKKDKLLKYAKNVLNIQGQDEEKTIKTAIDKTEHLFNNLGVKTKLSDYNLKQSCINKIVERFDRRGWNKLGENGNITIDKVKSILEKRK